MINFGFISLDIIIFVIIFAFLFFFSLKTGKKLLLSLIISVYPALLIFKNFPYISFEPGMPEAISFLIIYGLIIFGFYHGGVSNKKMYSPFRKFFDYSLLSLVYLILLISVSASYVPSLQNLYTFSGFIPNLVNQIDFGVVMILPIVAILLTTKNDRY